MALINEHYLKLKAGYLFPEIGRRVAAFSKENPTAKIIRLGIGDVTEPLVPAVVEAMHKAVDEMAVRGTFKGYGPEQGYDFLREAIAQHDYAARGCSITADEIFVSDGSKCDSGNILDIFGLDNKVAVMDPVYPVYVDTNVMSGRTGAMDDKGRYAGLVYMPATAENQFSPLPPSEPVDMVYLCYPNNPTGSVATREQLTAWVNYARMNHAIILYDAAYEAYIQDPNIPHSIYEIPGANEVAIEFRSFSKTAGFTGTRCAFTVVPKSLKGKTKAGEEQAINPLWNRRHTTKFNGVPYIIQRGAEAVSSAAGKSQVKSVIQFYMDNARIMREAFTKLGINVFGGEHAPYIWLETPGKKDSWTFFNDLLHNAHVVGTPGSGFGSCGEGYFRLSAFNSRENVNEAIARIEKYLR